MHSNTGNGKKEQAAEGDSLLNGPEKWPGLGSAESKWEVNTNRPCGPHKPQSEQTRFSWAKPSQFFTSTYPASQSSAFKSVLLFFFLIKNFFIA